MGQWSGQRECQMHGSVLMVDVSRVWTLVVLVCSSRTRRGRVTRRETEIRAPRLFIAFQGEIGYLDDRCRCLATAGQLPWTAARAGGPTRAMRMSTAAGAIKVALCGRPPVLYALHVLRQASQPNRHWTSYSPRPSVGAGPPALCVLQAAWRQGAIYPERGATVSLVEISNVRPSLLARTAPSCTRWRDQPNVTLDPALPCLLNFVQINANERYHQSEGTAEILPALNLNSRPAP